MQGPSGSFRRATTRMRLLMLLLLAAIAPAAAAAAAATPTTQGAAACDAAIAQLVREGCVGRARPLIHVSWRNELKAPAVASCRGGNIRGAQQERIAGGWWWLGACGEVWTPPYLLLRALRNNALHAGRRRPAERGVCRREQHAHHLQRRLPSRADQRQRDVLARREPARRKVDPDVDDISPAKDGRPGKRH